MFTEGSFLTSNDNQQLRIGVLRQHFRSPCAGGESGRLLRDVSRPRDTAVLRTHAPFADRTTSSAAVDCRARSPARCVEFKQPNGTGHEADQKATANRRSLELES